MCIRDRDYLEAWQKTGEQHFADVCRKTLTYVAEEMTAPQGAFYSATDADSKNPHGETEEGYFFSWTPAEIEQAVGAERAREIAAYYGVTKEGNFEGRNLFRAWRNDAEVAGELGISTQELHDRLAKSRRKLFEVRAKRDAPLLDDKVLVAWNGLMISAFARAGFAYNDEAFTNVGASAATFILDNRVRDARLSRV